MRIVNDDEVFEYLRLINELQQKGIGNSEYLDILRKNLIEEKHLNAHDHMNDGVPQKIALIISQNGIWKIIKNIKYIV